MFFDRRRLIRGAGALGFGVIVLAAACPVHAESGYDLWLRYAPVENAERRAAYRALLKSIVVQSRTATARAIVVELELASRRMLGSPVPFGETISDDGALVAGTPSSSPLVARLGWDKDLAVLGDEGYVIRSTRIGAHAATVVASHGEVGALYGTFHLLRLLQTEQPIDALDVSERPHIQRRVLNHWDNLDGTIERGYAGASLWKWEELPGRVDPRVQDYARANASIGINGSVVNSVNANPKSLSAAYIEKAAALADALRP
ncbi:MAG: alpha-glucuronidase, partial [Acidobacteria bacterium]